MRICLIYSVFGEKDAAKYAELPDPSRYISRPHHQFIPRHVTNKNTKYEIDAILEEGFDFYMNYMFRDESQLIAELEATRYLESKKVSILTGFSSFLSKDVFNLQSVAQRACFQVPRDTPGKFPKVVRHANLHHSDLDKCYVCDNEDSVKKMFSLLKEKNPTSKFVVQDYIFGTDFSVIVVEMGQEIVTLAPFQRETNTVHKHQLVEDTRLESLQDTAKKVFGAMGVTGNSGWARIDLRMEHGTDDVYVIGASALPFIFYPKGNGAGEDAIISEGYPGGHSALIDMLLATKQMQMKRHKDRDDHVAGVFDEFSIDYNSAWMNSGLHKIQQFLAGRFDYSGTVLDVACGAGAFGTVLHSANISAEVTGIELSSGMLKSPYIKNHYKHPIRIGAMQELIMGAGEFDHIVCFSSLHFLDRVYLIAVLSRMFMLARKSVSFDIDDLDEKYLRLISEVHGDLCFNANHVQAVRQFGVPQGWKLVYDNREFIFDVPEIGLDVYGYVMRFERV